MEYKHETRDVLFDLHMNDDQASVNGFEHIHELVLYIEELQSRIAELEKDAARYRFAKSNKSQGKSDIVIVHKIWGGDQIYLSGDKADTAIDTAMQKD